jgi:hypothetical protein
MRSHQIDHRTTLHPHQSQHKGQEHCIGNTRLRKGKSLERLVGEGIRKLLLFPK